MVSLSGYASQNQKHLPPHDTINAIVRTADGVHGIVELTWGAPVVSRVTAAHNALTVTGTDGWLEVSRAAGAIRVAVRYALLDAHGKITGEKEEVVEEREVGVQGEIQSFLRAAAEGNDDGIDGPRGTLVDVAFIQAALNSGGAPVDLEKLAQV